MTDPATRDWYEKFDRQMLKDHLHAVAAQVGMAPGEVAAWGARYDNANLDTFQAVGRDFGNFINSHFSPNDESKARIWRMILPPPKGDAPSPFDPRN